MKCPGQTSTFAPGREGTIAILLSLQDLPLDMLHGRWGLAPCSRVDTGNRALSPRRGRDLVLTDEATPGVFSKWTSQLGRSGVPRSGHLGGRKVLSRGAQAFQGGGEGGGERDVDHAAVVAYRSATHMQQDSASLIQVPA